MNKSIQDLVNSSSDTLKLIDSLMQQIQELSDRTENLAQENIKLTEDHLKEISDHLATARKYNKSLDLIKVLEQRIQKYEIYFAEQQLKNGNPLIN